MSEGRIKILKEENVDKALFIAGGSYGYQLISSSFI